MKFFSRVFLLAMLSLCSCDEGDDRNNNPFGGSDGDADGDADLVLEGDGIVFGGDFATNCVTDLGVDGEFHALGYNWQGQWGISFYWTEAPEGEVKQINIDVQWGDYIVGDAPMGPAKYTFTEEIDNLYDAPVLVEVYDRGPRYVPVAGQGSITFDSLDPEDYEGSVFSGSFDLMMHRVKIDEGSGDVTERPDNCTGQLTARWKATVIQDT